MKYIVEVLDSAKTKVAELSGMTAARLREKVNGTSVLTVETVERSEWSFFTPGKGYLRLRMTDGAICLTFRIMEIRKTRALGRASISVTGSHLLGDTAHELFADSVNCVNYTPEELMELVLGYSSFSVGTVEPTAKIPFVQFEYETVFDCLLRICSLTGGELYHDEDNSEIDLVDHIGSDNGVVFRYGLNLRGASRTVNLSLTANRVYGAGGGEPPLGLTGATESGGNPYVSDGVSISAYGLFEGVYHEPNLEDVTNLVATPALDGTYSGGLCQDWTKTGTPTVSKNTDPARYLYGKASQRIQSTADGDGISQSVTVTTGDIYSFAATLYLSSGTVRVQVNDGTSVYKRESPVTGTGFITVRVENWKAYSSAVTVKIFQEGSGTADFYVDSVQIAEGASVRPFTVGKSADTIYTHTAEYLAAHREPEITYTVDLIDLYGNTQANREADRFGLGDTVTVIDPTLDLDVSTRVMEREADIIRPWRVQVRLDNPAKTLADEFEAIRTAQEYAIKRQRSLLAGTSQAAETGSTRLGFNNQPFRFYGTITVTGWNSLTWSAGTLRAGNAYYAVGAGGSSGLAANTTYYYYFDRTTPTVLNSTSNMTAAESEDRILILAVTTTISPDLCVVHPMGIIHV